MNKEIGRLLKINETIITSEQCKEHRTLKNDERVLLMNNIKIKEYIQELEQKEAIINKVTDLVTKIATENAEKYNSKNQKEVDFSEWNLALEILNIIEGENHE